jgi:hypothetical protein
MNNANTNTNTTSNFVSGNWDMTGRSLAKPMIEGSNFDFRDQATIDAEAAVHAGHQAELERQAAAADATGMSNELISSEVERWQGGQPEPTANANDILTTGRTQSGRIVDLMTNPQAIVNIGGIETSISAAIACGLVTKTANGYLVAGAAAGDASPKR